MQVAIFGYNCYSFGLDFSLDLSFNGILMEPRPMSEGRNTMVANNFETRVTVLDLLPPPAPRRAVTSPQH
jgi:hypothetical protein